MYSFIRGELKESHPTHAVIEANGVGYKILIPLNVFSELPQVGLECLLHVSYVVREFSHALYGFTLAFERDLFETLQNVTGIGPKMALSLIGHLGKEALATAVHGENISALCKVPGIGKKTAERLVIELRDKVAYVPAEFAVKGPKDPKKELIKDAMNALVNLGYNHVTAQKALKKTFQDKPEESDLASLITHALKNV